MLRALVAVFALSFAFGALAADEPKQEAKKEKKAKTYEGTIVDVKCYSLDHKNTGDKHGDMDGCGKACLGQGLPAGLLSGKHLYVLAADPKGLADHVGQKAKVEGDLKDNVLIPSSTFKITGADGKEVEVGSGGH
jgi:outer membrane lipoprotein-sorting protein